MSLTGKHCNFVLIFALQHGCLGHGTVNIQPTPYKRHATQGKKGAWLDSNLDCKQTSIGFGHFSWQWLDLFSWITYFRTFSSPNNQFVACSLASLFLSLGKTCAFKVHWQLYKVLLNLEFFAQRVSQFPCGMVNCESGGERTHVTYVSSDSDLIIYIYF